jgi:NAD(P)-dependent dehydrogenase (short-subunit alcohol dehydrogenase family)
MTEASSGPVVVITGASAGIGAALARELAGRRASLVLVARREEILVEMAATLGTPVEVVPGDVTRRPDLERALERAVARFGGVDVWVNNAGHGITRASVEAVTPEDLDLMVRENTRSVLHGMQVVLPHFKARKRGVLVNVSSMLSRIPNVTPRAAYSAAKAALNSLTESLRFDLAREYPRIRVVLVLPGVVATDFGNNALGGGPDSRSIPGAQSVEEVARTIADGLFAGPVDLYTRPDGLERVVEYVRRLGREGPATG